MLQSLTTLTSGKSKSGKDAGSWLGELLRRWSARPVRQLRLRETLALGERRFVAVVELGRRRFLIGGTGSSMVLLARLPAADGEEQISPGEAE